MSSLSMLRWPGTDLGGTTKTPGSKQWTLRKQTRQIMSPLPMQVNLRTKTTRISTSLFLSIYISIYLSLSLYIYIYMICMCIHIYIYIYIYRGLKKQVPVDHWVIRGKILHTRNKHLGNHRGFSVAFSYGLSPVISMFQRIVTFPMDFLWIVPADFQWHFQTKLHCCDFRRVFSCPGDHVLPIIGRGEGRS